MPPPKDPIKYKEWKKKISLSLKGKPILHLKKYQFKKGVSSWIKGRHPIAWNKGKKGWTNNGGFKKGHKLGMTGKCQSQN
jgi:hypothetical protein